jgi:hypothetical protein
MVKCGCWRLDPAFHRPNGRLQWIGVDATWHFFKEPPTTERESSLGFEKTSSPTDPGVHALQQQLEPHGVRLIRHMKGTFRSWKPKVGKSCLTQMDGSFASPMAMNLWYSCC